MDSSTLLVAAAVAIAVLGAIWFGLRFWLASTRPADIKDVDTPTLDRLNREALERGQGEEEDGEEEEDDQDIVEEENDDEPDDDAPPGLRNVVPDGKI